MAKKALTNNGNKKPTKDIIANLKLRDIVDKVYQTKKEGTKEMRTVSLSDTDSGISVTLKGAKAYHPLRDWDKSILTKEDVVTLTLTVPKVTQTKITEFKNSDE